MISCAGQSTSGKTHQESLEIELLLYFLFHGVHEQDCIFRSDLGLFIFLVLG